MAQFKPVMVNEKANLMNVPIVDGQYIVVVDSKEIYLDRGAERVKMSNNTVTQATEPVNPVKGDVWFEIEE